MTITASVFDVLALLTTLVLGVILYVTWKYSYWARVGLPTLSPSFPYGDGKPIITGQLTYGEFFGNLYKRIKANGFKHAGIYIFLSPSYLPIDPEIIKNILQKDFQHFVNHGVFIDEENDPLSAHLFNLEDEKWKEMRVKLTPTFTSGKMKMMFQTLVDCSVGMKDIMDEAAVSRKAVDIKEILARFTTDIIGSVAFGLECNSLKNPDADFRRYGKKIFEVGRSDKIKLLLLQLLPKKILHTINFKRTKPDVEKFFMNVIRDTVSYREEKNIYRKDFLHMLIQLKNKGKVTDDSDISKDVSNSTKKGLTMNELAAQAFVFFFAGFETSSTTMTFALLELATHPEIQEKLRREIEEVLAKHENQITYAAIMEMTYMEKVIQETLRKHPPLPLIPRRCTKDYTIPNTTIHLKKGTRLNIPVYGIHHDPEYYPNPEKFDPERFSEENKKKRPDFTWLPFGEGPRICIGLRFGVLQSKVGLVSLLRNYKVGLNEKTPFPIKMDTGSLVASVAGGVWLDVVKIN